MKTVEKKGLQTMAKEVGLDLYSLPYTDARPERQEWLAQQPKNPPMVTPKPFEKHSVLSCVGAAAIAFCGSRSCPSGRKRHLYVKASAPLWKVRGGHSQWGTAWSRLLLCCC